MKIETLDQDHQSVMAQNEFRANTPGLSKAKNPYSWWKYAFAVLVVHENGCTWTEIVDYLKEIHVNISNTSGSQLKKVVNLTPPDPILRNYSKNLPGYASLLGLTLSNEYKRVSVTGPAATIFKFGNPELAKQLIKEGFPELNMLVDELSKKLYLKIMSKLIDTYSEIKKHNKKEANKLLNKLFPVENKNSIQFKKMFKSL